MTDRPTFVSLFAGAGGFDLAFQRAGFDCIGQCEIEPKAVDVLARHFPNTPRHDDVTTITATTFEHPDVITFGSPCQDLSTAGRRAGLAGAQSGLFLHAVRYIREVQEATDGDQPSVALWENVPGAFSSNGGADFAAVLESLVAGDVRHPADGWTPSGIAFGPRGTAEWRTLDSQHFGVPQRRRRVFLVYRPRGRRAGAVLLEPASVPRDTPPVEASRQGPPARAREGLVARSGERVTALAGGLGSGGPIAFAMRGRDGGNMPEVDGDGQRVHALRAASGGSTRDLIAFQKGKRAASKEDDESWRESEIVPTLNAFDQGDARATTAIVKGPPSAVRRLTPRESERLQGFPDDWTRYRPDGSEIADTHRYRMMGNAVTVNVVEWIAHRIRKELP